MAGRQLATLSDLFKWVAEEELPRRKEADEALFICPSIKSAPCSQALKDRALQVIDGRLGNLTYIGWLAKHHRHLVTPKLYPTAAFEGRVQWCQALAEEFSKGS